MMTQPTLQHGEPVGSSPPPAGPQAFTCFFGADVPYHIESFIGREAELGELRAALGPGSASGVRRPPTVLFGMAGVGKSQLAAEYAYLYQDEYEFVWWVRASDERAIWDSLLALGYHLNLPDISPDDQDRSLATIHSALQSHPRSLLIFDDVTEPATLRRFLPPGTGHVIVTSRVSEWRQVLATEGIGVPVLRLEDTIAFLRGRVPELAPHPGDDAEQAAAKLADADRLARTVGNLPLAAEHAASYLAQESASVSEYIEAFEDDPQTLLGKDPDSYADGLVAKRWNKTRAALSDEADHLFCFLACFAPEPVEEELLARYGSLSPRPAVPAALARVLGSREELQRAERELMRLSLISRPRGRDAVLLHRVVQGVTQARTDHDDPELAAALRETLLALLVQTAPGNPELEPNDSKYQLCYPHLIEARAPRSDDPRVRELVKNQVRRLWLRGCYREARALGEAARSAWGAVPDNFDALAISIEVAIALRMLGQTRQAFELNGETLQRLYDTVGGEDKTYLRCANSYGEDLRLLGRYEDALAHDSRLVTAYERAYGPDEYRSSRLRNNIAVDLRNVGQYEESLSFDIEAAEQREKSYGPESPQALSSKYGVSSSLRRLGRFQEALTVSDEASEIVNIPGKRTGLLGPLTLAGRGVALRLLGRRYEAHELAEHVYDRCKEEYGPRHRVTLVAATNLMCDRRLVEDFAGAQELGEATVAAWDKVAGADHPNALIARVNLAFILRVRGSRVDARKMNEAALAGFGAAFTSDHPYQPIVMTNLASVLADEGETRQAREYGEKAVRLSEALLGDAHPITLTASANLALDLKATDDRAAGLDLEAQTLAKLKQQLPDEHPLVVRAIQHDRLNIDIEPTTL